jgi:transcription-repair coupling factor (superfamily II helicase)
MAIDPSIRTGSDSHEILERLLQSDQLDRLAALVNRTRGAAPRPGAVIVSGLAGSARALLLVALEEKLERRIVFVARSNREAEEIQPDVEFFYSGLTQAGELERGAPGAQDSHKSGSESSSGPAVVAIPSSDGDPYDGTSPHAEVLEERALALYRAASESAAGESAASEPEPSRQSARIVLTSLRALAERAPSPESISSSGITLKIKDEMPLELIVDLLISSGYVREEPVASVGEFSLRGGILDVFSPAHDWPHRLEFFGDVVDSIREFDPDTQRSTHRVSESRIPPMRELSVRREEFIGWADIAARRWTGEIFRRDLRARLAHAERGEQFPGWEYLLPLSRPLPSSAFDYFKDAVFVVDEPSDIERAASELYGHLETRFAEAEEAGELALPPGMLFLSPDEMRSRFDTADRIELRLLGRAAAATDERFRIDALTLKQADAGEPAGAGEQRDAVRLGTPKPDRPPVFLFHTDESRPEVSLISQSARRYNGRVQDLARDLESDVLAGKLVTLVMPSLGLAERATEMLAEYDIAAQLVSGLRRGVKSTGPIVTVGSLTNGFALPAADLSILIDSDVFGDVDRMGPQRGTGKSARKQRSIEAFLSDLGDLKVGDYVVHIDHGIGQFQGLTPLPVVAGALSVAFNVAEGIGREASVREFMLLTYAEGARLYVPVERLDLIQRYSAAEGAKPQLDRLGGVGWQKTKARATRAMHDMAEELLKLYTERKLVPGYAYGGDSPWQREFEDAFEYTLTPDQEAAVGDVKSDMESPQPMDRLVVGDVGYGKTEVAMRAAFKAVMEGKQVAVLAPTTVLVYQHYKTFQQRFSAFPARIEMLSRFRGAREQKEIVKAIEAGSIDVVVGTHRLLSKDLLFKDLGLLVVDEEQRFGVAHKERIKQLRKKVDVIAMSATPIPRTLNMSLAGMRDMSVIETPPRDRLAIQTQVVQFSEPVIRNAIELELQRGGQIFFVHNRVETIQAIAELIGRLAPGARIGIGHGQMGEKELEDVMLKFIRHELDLLVCTTIIENGIDIPLANTMIVNRADMYGLSQLYQLRGRVGRSNRRAYAYLLIPSEDSLTEIARRRLAAIREFSDLGAGFRIAALDLELRGAGNLLGREQSGHIEAIGFDMYTRMLERSVRELKGEAIDDETSATVNLGVDIRIPQDYIYDMSQRLRIYKRVSSADSDKVLADVHGEIEDRYGPIPETVENLFEYSRIRREAGHLGVVSIDREGDRLAVKFSQAPRIDPDKLLEMVASADGSFAPSGVLKITLASQDDAELFDEVRYLLDRLRRQPQEQG